MDVGEYAKLRDIVMHHIHACKIIGLSTLGLQLLALMVSCSLHYAENTPRQEYRPVPARHHDFESASQISVQVCSFHSYSVRQEQPSLLGASAGIYRSPCPTAMHHVMHMRLLDPGHAVA